VNPSPPNNRQIIRVLVVDDNSDAAHTTGMWLELSGHKVDVLTHSVECLPHLETFNPDVLLLDIAMPGISGYDLAKQIRSQPKFDRLVIFAVSGYGDAPHVQRSIDCGCDPHLVKPVDLHVLKEVIASEVQKSHSALGG
jgi:CheY-like chemotaxis protein